MYSVVRLCCGRYNNFVLPDLEIWHTLHLLNRLQLTVYVAFLIEMRKQYSIAKTLPAFLAAILLVFASSSHIHLRFCLDGDEPPVSIHFESEDLHSNEVATIDDGAGEDQADVEHELSLDTLLTKIFESAVDAVAVSTFYITDNTSKPQDSFLLIGREILPDRPESLLPPPRAPPALA